MLRLSVIIPVSDDAESLETTLVSVLQNRPADCEVLVVHGCCYDDPYDLRDEVRFVEARAGAGVLELINAGIEAAEGEVIHWLQCGLRVEDGWTERALAHFDDPQVGAVSPLLLDGESPGRILVAGVSYDTGGTRRVSGFGFAEDDLLVKRLPVLGPSLLAAYYRKSAVAELGGLDSTMGGDLADIDLALGLEAAGYRCVLEPASRVFGPRLGHAALSGFAAGRCAERLFWRHARSRGLAKSLMLHACTVASCLLTDLPHPTVWSRLLGRGVACLESVGAGARHRRPLGETLAAEANGRRLDRSTAPRSPIERRAA